jgi:hypothetical protein
MPNLFAARVMIGAAPHPQHGPFSPRSLMTVSQFTLDFDEGAYGDVVRVSSNADGDQP